MATAWTYTSYDPETDEAPEGSPIHDCTGVDDPGGEFVDPPDIVEGDDG